MKKTTIIICFFCLLNLSCKKFLAETSQNKAYVQTATDLQELLIGSGYMEYISNTNPTAYFSLSYGTGTSSDVYFPYLDVLNDDAEEFVSGNQQNATSNSLPRNVLSGFHRWQQDPLFNTAGVQIYDYNWTRMYQRIAALNAIIYKARDLKGSDDQQILNRVEGEALFLRAGYYFFLVNLYGMPYNKATASTDAGVPLKISESISDKYYSRDAVGKVYDQILTDLNQSSELLAGTTQPNIYRVRQAAAFAMLSRVNLYMENYQAAVDAADKVLAAGYSLTDLNSYVAGTSFSSPQSPENIFSQGSYLTYDVFVDESSGFNNSYKASPDLLSSFASTDLRLQAFFNPSSTSKQLIPTKSRTAAADAAAFTPISSYFLLRLSEVILNKAEAQALLGNDAGAQTSVQSLRSKRFKPADLTTITFSGRDLVDFIREERRRELCFEGQRWFDLRRYAVNSKYPFTKSITHKYFLYSSTASSVVASGAYVLKPYPEDVNAYMTPIPVSAIQFNQGALVNFDRPARPITP
ncbi:RagB/SusD family nutrient uptake outer membrane protein [Pedobacter frigidisoli]|uniref:RagB/SusD family nutrient uptake outer membrane protein n=1 Tax=Pedobacter frigidisoli TaxID=2530455 RepID=UPI00292D733E|nr:RagB/SusD family nutrient uptake outer membrane protein [Pedobacter frigidisoli]